MYIFMCTFVWLCACIKRTYDTTRCSHIETYYNILWHCPDVANDPLFLPMSLSHGFPPTDLSEDFLDQSLCNSFMTLPNIGTWKAAPIENASSSPFSDDFLDQNLCNDLYYCTKYRYIQICTNHRIGSPLCLTPLRGNHIIITRVFSWVVVAQISLWYYWIPVHENLHQASRWVPSQPSCIPTWTISRSPYNTWLIKWLWTHIGNYMLHRHFCMLHGGVGCNPTTLPILADDLCDSLFSLRPLWR